MDWQGSASPIPTSSNVQDATTMPHPHRAPRRSQFARSPNRFMLTQLDAQPAYALSYRTLVAARGADVRARLRGASFGFVGWLLVIQRLSTSLRHSPPLFAGTGPPSVVIGRAPRRPSHCPRARRSVCPVRMPVRIPTSWVIERPSRARASTGKLALRGTITMRR